ncbi:hypothetical protein Zmor_020194 [Zophobas morio]|uniref:Uncharacterized protein n=1 Tax=Zophobas morio TaxID=2755281 RepID=A0AA38I4W7_9CUCU|nr:hypothetical protein Zmor_020194 [Zophobas morio]
MQDQQERPRYPLRGRAAAEEDRGVAGGLLCSRLVEGVAASGARLAASRPGRRAASRTILELHPVFTPAESHRHGNEQTPEFSSFTVALPANRIKVTVDL